MQPSRLVKQTQPLTTFPANGGGFYFIATVLDVKLTLPADITQTIRVDRADQSQIAEIYRFLDSSQALGLGGFRRQHYEHDWIPICESNCTRYDIRALAPDEWRYYIIAYSGTGNDVIDLLKVMDIIPPYICAFSYVITTQPFGCGCPCGFGTNPFSGSIFYANTVHVAETFDNTHLNLLRKHL